MAHRYQSSRSVLFRPFVAVLVAVVLAVVPLAAAAQEATPFVGTLEPDLPAMLLTPADLEAAGMPGFQRFYNGNFVGIEAVSQGNAPGWAMSPDEFREVYEGFGWRRNYITAMGLPSVPGDSDSPATRGVTTSAQELDGDQADAYFTFFGAPAPDPAVESTVVDPPFSIGDGAIILNQSFLDAEAGIRVYEFRLIFHRGDVFAHVLMWIDLPVDPATQGTPGATPAPAGLDSPAGTIDELERLGRRQLERIDAVLAGEGPDLPSRILRIGNDPLLDSAWYSEGYRLLDGEFPPYYGGFEDDILADPNATAGAEAVYELEQGFQRGEEGAPGDPYFLTRLYRFPDEAAATEFMATRPDAVATGGFMLATGATDEARYDLLPGEAGDLGDESLAFNFVRAFDDGGRAEGYEVYVRVGAIVAAVSLEGPPDMPLDQVTELAAAQAVCLEAGECPEAYPVPEDFSAPPPGTPEATPAT